MGITEDLENDKHHMKELTTSIVENFTTHAKAFISGNESNCCDYFSCSIFAFMHLLPHAMSYKNLCNEDIDKVLAHIKEYTISLRDNTAKEK